tara:strand:+ start:270 stop:476 length:207 start_codon:yes stop_codon:yes gene_type:complete
MTTLKDMEKYLIPIPMAWDEDQKTPEAKIGLNKSDIIMALDNLKELGVPRRVVVKFLIQEIREIFGGK